MASPPGLWGLIQCVYERCIYISRGEKTVLLMNEYKDAPPTETILPQCSYLFILEGGIPRMAA